MPREFEGPVGNEFQSQSGELLESVQQVPERNEITEITQVLKEKLTELQKRIALIPIELGAQKYQYEVGKTIHNYIQEVIPGQNSETSPSAEQFK